MDDEEARRAAQVEWFKNSLDHHENLSAAVVSFGQSLLRGALTLNGGAIIALLSVYGVVDDKPQIAAPLAIWALGLGFCAIAGYCAAKSQREFQVASGNNSRRLAKQFFGLELSDQPVAPMDKASYGRTLREIFWGLWLCSIGAFVVGAFAAIYHFS